MTTAAAVSGSEGIECEVAAVTLQPLHNEWYQIVMKQSKRYLSRVVARLLIARAAWGLTRQLRLVLHMVHHLNERWSHLRLGMRSLRRLDHRRLDVFVVALAAVAALLILLDLARGALGLLAHELALGARAQSRLLALPVALGLLAHGRAQRRWVSAASSALGWRAHRLALGAVLGLADVLRAAHVALRLVAMNLARRGSQLLTVHLALGALTHRVALRGAGGVITLPTALRMASLLALLHIQLILQLHLGLRLDL